MRNDRIRQLCFCPLEGAIVMTKKWGLKLKKQTQHNQTSGGIFIPDFFHSLSVYTHLKNLWASSIRGIEICEIRCNFCGALVKSQAFGTYRELTLLRWITLQLYSRTETGRKQINCL